MQNTVTACVCNTDKHQETCTCIDFNLLNMHEAVTWLARRDWKDYAVVHMEINSLQSNWHFTIGY